MKTTGIIRKVDSLGRIVLPSQLRRTMGLKAGDDVEILVDDGRIILQKFSPACIFCGGSQSLVSYRGKVVCRACCRAISGNKQA